MERNETITEAEWFACVNPQTMIAALAGQFNESQLRQFAVACCRRIWPLIQSADVGAEEAVALAEQHISASYDSDSKRLELCTAAAAATAAFASAAVSAKALGDLEEAKSYAAHAAFASSALTGTGYADEEAMIWSVAADAAAADDMNKETIERKAQAAILREIVGNPFKANG